MTKTRPRISLAMTYAIGLLMGGTQPVLAGEPITVARMQLTASLACADGRQAQLAHMRMSVPQGTATVIFSPPLPAGEDPYSARWFTVNPCAARQEEQVEVNLRNITTTRFIATIKDPSDRRAWMQSDHQQLAIRVGGATLTLRSEVVGTEIYQDMFDAAKAAHAAAAEYDASAGVPSWFGGIGPAMSWATASGEH